MLNPVLKREIKSLFRSKKFFIGTGIYLLLLISSVNMIVANMQSSYMEPQDFQEVYYFMLGFQVLAIFLIVPATCGGSVSGERERQTLDLLLVTKMTPAQIIRGKIYSSLLTVTLIMLASLPVYGLLYYYGGISVLNFLSGTFYSLVTAVVMASLSVYASARFKRTTVAMVFIYLSVFVYSCVFILIVMLLTLLVGDGLYFLGFTVSFFNPVLNFVSLIDSQMGTDISWDMLSVFDFELENTYIYVWHINLITSAIFVYILNKLSIKAIDPLK